MWQIERYYKKLWLESSTQGENCVMESRQWSSWWRVHVSHVKAFELYNSPAQMASLRTQTQHLFLRPVTCARHSPLTISTSFTCSSPPKPDPNASLFLKALSGHTSLHRYLYLSDQFHILPQVCVGWIFTFHPRDSELHDSRVSYPFPCPIWLNKYFLTNYT